jgi:hypothetical protein
LCAILMVALLAWSLTFSVSIFRLVFHDSYLCNQLTCL